MAQTTSAFVSMVSCFLLHWLGYDERLMKDCAYIARNVLFSVHMLFLFT